MVGGVAGNSYSCFVSAVPICRQLGVAGGQPLAPIFSTLPLFIGLGQNHRGSFLGQKQFDLVSTPKVVIYHLGCG